MTLGPNESSALLSKKAGSCRRITPKPPSGTARPLNKVIQGDNGCSVPHTTEAWVCPKTTWKQRNGIAGPLIRAKHQPN